MKAIEERLQQLIALGAGIFILGESKTRPLAAARILAGNQLWYCELWPENDFAQHWAQVSDIRPAGTNLNLFALGAIVATIAPLDPDEREAAQWNLWQSADPDAVRGREFVARLEADALGQKGEQ